MIPFQNVSLIEAVPARDKTKLGPRVLKLHPEAP